MEGEVEEKAIFSRSAAPAITTSSFLLPPSLQDRAKGAKVDHVYYYYYSGIARESKHGPNLPVIILSGGLAAIYSTITTFSMSTFKPLTTAQVLLY